MLIWGKWKWHQSCSWICQVSWFSGYSVLRPTVLSCSDHSLYWLPWWPLQWRGCLRQVHAGTLWLLRMSDKFSIPVGTMLSQQKVLSVLAQHWSSCWFEWMSHLQCGLERSWSVWWEGSRVRQAGLSWWLWRFFLNVFKRLVLPPGEPLMSQTQRLWGRELLC